MNHDRIDGEVVEIGLDRDWHPFHHWTVVVVVLEESTEVVGEEEEDLLLELRLC